MALALAKLTRPDTSEALLRERLFTQLDTARNSPLIWVNAPAGAGKTTLISSYIESRNCRNLWYQVDKGDTDMATFFHYMGQAVKNASRSRKKMPTLTPEYQLGVPEFTRNYFREVFNRLQPPALLVLDNFQDAGEGADLYEMLAGAFAEIPKGINVIIISRTEPPATFSRLRANQQLSQINWMDLQFTIDEELAITQQRYPHRNITKQQLQKLNMHIRGWISGLILLLEQGVELDEVELDNKEMSPEYLFDYFATEIFYKIDEQTQQFLIKTSMLPRMSASICKQLTGNRAANQILSELARKQYFTVRHGIFKPNYEYHPLFREFLQSRAEESFAQSEYKNLQSTAGILLAKEGDIDNAMSLLERGENWLAMSELILKYAKEQIELGRNRQISRWIEALPEDVIEQQPWLIYWHGMSRLQYENNAARDVFEKAYAQFKLEKNALGLYLSWCGIADSYVFVFDSFAGADKWVKELEWLQQAYPDPHSMEARGRLIFSASQLIFWIQPNHPLLPKWMGQMEKIYRFIPNKFLVIMSSVQLSIYYSQVGEVSKVRNISKRIEKLIPSVSHSPLLKSLLLLTSYANDWMTADFELSYEFIDSSQEALKNEGIKIFSGLMLAHALYHAACKNNLPRFKMLLDMYGEIVVNESILDYGHYQSHCCYYEILCGNYERAIQYGKVVIELVDQANAPLPQWVSHCMLAFAYIESSQFELAQKQLKNAQKIIDEIKMPGSIWTYRMMCSYLAFKLNNQQDMLTHLQVCFRLGREKDIKASAVWPPIMISTLCSLALEHNIEPDYARSIIRIYNYTPRDSLHVGEHWPWPLKIYTLGRFSVLLNNKPLETETRPFDILKALLAFGGRDVHEEKIMDALWPDAEGDQAQASFKTSLHRLRKVLGEPNVLILKNHQLSLNEQYAWVDAWAISRLFEPAQHSIKIKNTAQNIELAGRLMQYYRGHFFASEHNSWVIHQRESLRLRFIRHTLAVAQAIENKDSQIAIQCYQRLLETDTLIEEAYQGLIRCYQAQGRQAEAQVIYEKCVTLFDSINGSSPSSATTNLLKE
jgi:DNA-binding SARP family transcriptional activator